MSYTRISHLVYALVLGAAVGGAVTQAAALLGALLPLQPMLMGLVPVALAVVLLVLGLRVRRLKEGKETTLTVLGALRVALFAKASSLVGAFLTGTYGLWAAYYLFAPDAPLMREQSWACGGGAVGCLVLTIVGAIVERWCRVDPPEDEDLEADKAAPSGVDPTLA